MRVITLLGLGANIALTIYLLIQNNKNQQEVIKKFMSQEKRLQEANQKQDAAMAIIAGGS